MSGGLTGSAAARTIGESWSAARTGGERRCEPPAARDSGDWHSEPIRRVHMFGLPGFGNVGGFFPIYIIMFMVNVVFKLIFGGLGDLFPTDGAM
jgi:hypothetical protein